MDEVLTKPFGVDDLRLLLTDLLPSRDGAGPDETHVGMRIMRERAQNIGATVEVESVPGSGTCVVLKLPQRQGLAA